MKTFDFYEFTGVLVPGTVLLFSISLLYPKLGLIVQGKDFTTGQLGLFIILSYVAGHLLQGIGNFLEQIFWKFFQGMPTDWIRQKKGNILSNAQILSLENQIHDQLNLEQSVKLSELNQKDWFNFTRQIYVAIDAADRSKRVDIFSGNYGLFRGIASAFIASLMLFIIENGLSNWKILLLLLLGILISLLRMYRFGKLYAKELFFQFIQLPKPTIKSSDSTKIIY
ncbi:hypothetical protein [Cyanothece sp. BG0011]|uniref:hypothetical protein n=1 Tax=Cyanothece sp. BG0011 TaxID=2082950 RepID=UPI000D1EFA31|nr:hypothetical protein [Cyanothece sp. BG0011]